MRLRCRGVARKSWAGVNGRVASHSFCAPMITCVPNSVPPCGEGTTGSCPESPGPDSAAAVFTSSLLPRRTCLLQQVPLLVHPLVHCAGFLSTLDYRSQGSSEGPLPGPVRRRGQVLVVVLPEVGHLLGAPCGHPDGVRPLHLDLRDDEPLVVSVKDV